MKYEAEFIRGNLVVKPQARMLSHEPETDQFVQAAYREGLIYESTVVVDLAGVEEVDLGGVVSLISLKRHLAEDGYDLILADPLHLLCADGLRGAVIAGDLQVFVSVEGVVEYLNGGVWSELAHALESRGA